MYRMYYLMLPLLLGTAADQLSKYIARTMLHPGSQESYLYGLVQLEVVQNNAGFLGYFSIIPEKPRFLLLTVGVGSALFVAAGWIVKRKLLTSRERVAAACVLAGGTGNLLDRLFHNGGVTDFIRIGIGPLTTGIFNFADIYILAGSFFLGSSYAMKNRRFLP